jgi:DNA mismatch repair protein MutL
MPDIIQLLPDSVANQIAAGEVIQRPASVIKELVENAIDGQGKNIIIIIKDSGRTLIQVIDNGTGMSGTDARMSFERHATSKIRSADDLFAIRSMGFRGEALASIAAIAEVTMQARRIEDELGTELLLLATEVISQENIACTHGCSISVKNLFFNVPARRKFLKSDSYEFRLIISEIQRVALAFPEVEFKLQHNSTEIFQLTPCNHKQRIVQLFGKAVNQHLIDIKTNTTLVKINGFIGKPENAKKNQGEQFFFVNNRFMRHPYFHKALMNAYNRLLQPDAIPSYFIWFEIDPGNIDVNIHPTKTEIKFEDEQAIWQILNATAKEALGKFNVAPSLDFNTESAIEIPVLTKDTQIRMPSININPHFNPFDGDDEKAKNKQGSVDYFKSNNLSNWESLYSGFERTSAGTPLELKPEKLFNDKEDQSAISANLIQLKGKYILSPVRSGLMIIDQKRAHERILYENFMKILEGTIHVTQQILFPQVIELNASDHTLLMEYLDVINQSGFDIRDFGNNSIVVNGCPAEIPDANPKELIERMLEEMHHQPSQQATKTKEYMATLLCKASAIPYGKTLSAEEIHNFIDKLFACGNHNFSPDGKPVISIIPMEELEKRMK